MLRSNGVAEEAACMVYLAISKLQVRMFGGGVEKVKVYEGNEKGERRSGTKEVREIRGEK